MKLRTRLLVQMLSALLVFVVFLSVLLFLFTSGIRKTALAHSSDLGNSAAGISSYALEEQVGASITRLVEDMAVILDEKLIKIENHTRMTADIAGSIYTRREAYRPHPLRRVIPGETPPPEPYIHAAPGVDFSAIRRETDLAGNIGEVLRQITVIDRGITTSTIGGESGYIIAMDAFPWPSADFDPRINSWYTGAKEKGDLFWTDVYADPRGRGPVISCSMPFYEGSEEGIFRGVARSTVMLADFAKIIESAKVGHSGYIFLLNQKGLRLFSSGTADVWLEGDRVIGENYLESGKPGLRSLGISMTLGARGLAGLEMDGLQVYAAYAPVQTLGWSLGVAVPVQEMITPAWLIEEQIRNLTGSAQNAINRQILLLAGIGGLVLLAALFASAWLSVRFTRSITGPILALGRGVEEVSGGSLDREVSVKTGDELEQLAENFNKMTCRLREHIAAVAEAAAEKERDAAELNVAAQIQVSMLPSVFPPFKGRKNDFELYAEIHPAKEVGGDFYDFFFIDDDHFAVVIADVSGKGVPAALFMTIAKTLIKNQLQTGETLDRALENVNAQLCRNNIADMFVTVWTGVLEISSGSMKYINAGHNPPLVQTGGGGFSFLASPPDLFVAGMDGTVYHHGEIFLEDGGLLFLYTDGVTEAADIEENCYGKERLREFLDRHSGLPLLDLLPRIRSEIDEFSRGTKQADDITMLALKIARDGPFVQAAPDNPAPAAARNIRLYAVISELEKFAGFIGEELDNAACPEKIRGMIELAAEEIFVNIVNYAYTDSPIPETVSVTFGAEHTAAGSSVTIVFEDQGKPFNPLDHADPDLSVALEEREIGGLGLLLVKRTMDTVQYSYDEPTNRLIVKKSW